MFSINSILAGHIFTWGWLFGLVLLIVFCVGGYFIKKWWPRNGY